MLARKWNERKKKCDFVVIGSGYGGAILAARISGADLNPKKTVCLLERGKEWFIGRFPDTLSEVSAAARHFLIYPPVFMIFSALRIYLSSKDPESPARPGLLFTTS